VVVNGTVANDVSRVVNEIKSAGGTAVGCVESVATMAGAQRIIQTAWMPLDSLTSWSTMRAFCETMPFWI